MGFRFNDWAKQYGPLYSIKLASQNAIVISDRRLVKELMDKKSSVSSARPRALFFESVYEGRQILLLPHTDPRWRFGRKMIHQYFGETRDKHVSVINAEAVQLLHDLCQTPKEFSHHLKRFSNSLIMSLGETAPSLETFHADL
jgi:hypothetical protein